MADPDNAPSPLLAPLRILLAVTALGALVVLFLVGLASCQHSGKF